MRLAFAIASVSVAACGLSVVGMGTEAVTDEPDGAVDASTSTSTVDGVAPPSTDAAGAVDAGHTPDGGPDADAAAPLPDAGNPCTTTTDTFPTIDPSKWTISGASSRPDGGVQLTKNGSSNQVTGIWTAKSMPLGSSVHVTVTFRDEIPSGADDGVGVAIGWAGSTGLGGTGEGLGICASSLNGVASLLYTESPQRVQVATAISGECQTIGSNSTNVGATGTLELVVKSGGSVTAQTTASDSQTTNATVPKTGFVGVTASTGNTQRSNFTLTSIKIESCP